MRHVPIAAAVVLLALLFARGAWVAARPALPAPETLGLDGSTMCGEPYSLTWGAVAGASRYDIEYIGSTKGDAGLFCMLTHPFSAASCACDRYDENLPAACLDGSSMATSTAAGVSLVTSGWAVHYRVRAMGARGERGHWSDIRVAGCWIE